MPGTIGRNIARRLDPHQGRGPPWRVCCHLESGGTGPSGTE